MVKVEAVLETMQNNVAAQDNGLTRALAKFYLWVHSMDAKYGRPNPVKIPSIQQQRLFAIVLLACQTGITFTGALVRVTGSGLGCTTWPNCQPGSLIPVAGTEPWIHQLIEFGNRLLTFVLIATFVVTFIALIRAGRRINILHLALVQGVGIIAQAVIGGVTVWLDLAWWMVIAHSIPSMILVFFAAVLVVRIGEPDDGADKFMLPRPIVNLMHGLAVALFGVLITPAP